jgi:hypothetical protein
MRQIASGVQIPNDGFTPNKQFKKECQNGF